MSVLAAHLTHQGYTGPELQSAGLTSNVCPLHLDTAFPFQVLKRVGRALFTSMYSHNHPVREVRLRDGD